MELWSNLCSSLNGKTYFIDVGETGIIKGGNASSLASSENLEQSAPQRCSVELVTCPSCHIVVSNLSVNIPKCSSVESCRCDYVFIKETAYAKFGQEFCGTTSNQSSTMQYESKTKLITIEVLHSFPSTDSFAVQFKAVKNVYVLKGHHDFYQSNTTGFFESPHFPVDYPRDYSAEYIIRNIENKGYIQLIFTDFQLSYWSYIEVYDSDSTRINVYRGNVFRPPIIISSGPILTLKFQASDGHPSRGFRAKYTFISPPHKDWLTQPSTDCGGIVDDKGGAITMMNMSSSIELQPYDCVWLIRPRNSDTYETHLFIRVAEFEFMGPKSVLVIHQGLTSKSNVLETVTSYRHHKIPRGREYVIPANEGFYVRLKGFFSNKSRLAIVYGTFRYEECYSTGEFQCLDGRCLTHRLRCDAFNHCVDGSDEHSCSGHKGLTSSSDSDWWEILTPNYYFPKHAKISEGGNNTIVLIACLAGIGIFILTTIMILVKLHKKRSDADATRGSLRTISGEIDQSRITSRLIVMSDPPRYDPPPSYEDVLKFYLSPPPTYTSVFGNRLNQERSLREVSGNLFAIDNVAYVSDSPTDQEMETSQVLQVDQTGGCHRSVLTDSLPLPPYSATSERGPEEDTKEISANSISTVEKRTTPSVSLSQGMHNILPDECANISESEFDHLDPCGFGCPENLTSEGQAEWRLGHKYSANSTSTTSIFGIYDVPKPTTKVTTHYRCNCDGDCLCPGSSVSRQIPRLLLDAPSCRCIDKSFYEIIKKDQDEVRPSTSYEIDKNSSLVRGYSAMICAGNSLKQAEDSDQNNLISRRSSSAITASSINNLLVMNLSELTQSQPDLTKIYKEKPSRRNSRSFGHFDFAAILKPNQSRVFSNSKSILSDGYKANDLGKCLTILKSQENHSGTYTLGFQLSPQTTVSLTHKEQSFQKNSRTVSERSGISTLQVLESDSKSSTEKNTSGDATPLLHRIRSRLMLLSTSEDRRKVSPMSLSSSECRHKPHCKLSSKLY
ncbi:uncharacterized protein LOC106459125 [Limulus polyphemus]|uniref:Uncharacterized protein LOC106459125 n=1 Tax=Limulus polyphemus TaxID=6850 RepID=A0ABM1SCB5_LIMPO|nr:uncharacterized protein LOC106459125 [Limulus polyphemus]